MAIKSMWKRLVVRGAKLAASQADQVRRDGRNVDICLAAALRELGELAKISYPTAYVELLRSSIEPMACVVNEVRHEQAEDDRAAMRFATLVDVLRADATPIPLR